MSDASTLNRFVQRSGDLYSLPAVAVDVLRLTDSPKVDVRALKDCIERDPALTTRILRVVNSSLFGLPREISDLNQALALLGIKPLKLLVLGFSLPTTMFEGIEADVLARYWRRALTRSAAARELCQQSRTGEADEAFIAGLLQDVGLLVLIQELGEPYVRFLDRVVRERGDLDALEHASLGFTHRQLSAALLEHWKLPAAIVQAIDADAIPAAAIDDAPPRHVRPLRLTLQLADDVASLIVDERFDLLDGLLTRVAAQFGWNDSQLAAIVDSLENRVAQLASAFALKLPAGASYRDILAVAHRRLAGVAAEAVPDVVRADRTRAAAAPMLDADAQVDDLWNQTQQLGAAVEQFLDGSSRRAAPRRRADSPQAVLPPMAAIASNADAVNPSAAKVALEVQLEARLVAATASCRARRAPLTLLLVAIDRFAEVTFATGASRAEQIAAQIASICQRTTANAECEAAGDGVWAVVLRDCDRNQAVRHSGNIAAAVRSLPTNDAVEEAVVTVSIGVATVALPPKNFSIKVLVERASRCLYAAQSAGGNVQKSIEILG
jgi:diguanylate cyclase (GGDEF)-like protein